MRVLTIDTATTAVSVGLAVAGQVYAAPPIRDATAAQHVLNAVDEVLDAAGLRISDVDRIVVGCGPGSFTGLRVGLATAHGLAASGGAELVGVSTLAALCIGAGDADAVGVIDARRGEVFVATATGDPAACSPQDLAARLSPHTLLVGDGAVRYRDLLSEQTVPPDDSPLHVPRATAMIALSAIGAPAIPAYVRPPDAVPTEQRA